MNYFRVLFSLLLCSICFGQPERARGKGEQGVHLLSMMNTVSVQFLVTARDEVTKEPISNFSLQADPQDERSAGGGSVSGSGVLRVGLSGGKYALLVSAKGYLMEVFEGIEIPGEHTGGFYSTYPVNPIETFGGTTIGLDVRLRRLDPNSERKTRRRPFLSDTTYYEITNPAPELIGGTAALVKRIRNEAKSLFSANETVIKAAPFCTAYIDKKGNVVRVEIDNKGRYDVDRLVSEAISQSKFSPGQILGKPVNSKIMIPFDLTLRFPRKTP